MNARKIPRTAPQAAVSGPCQTSPPHRVLVVDGDSDLCLFYADALPRPGFEVDAVEDGEAAWQALNSQSYDLLITGNKIPKVSGIELIKKVRAARMLLPVIMATSAAPTEEFARSPWLQPDAILLKPYHVDELLGTVHEVLLASDSARKPIAP